MKNRKYILSAVIAALAMLLMVLDPDTAKSGVSDGLSLCMDVIIPSLFPFFIASLYLNASLQSIKIPGMRLVGKRLHIPSGCESILLLGLTGGYPVGAQLVASAYEENRINKCTAHILLGYCNNAGPAFIFGMAGSLFSSTLVPIFLWAVHIFSALLTGAFLPKPEYTQSQIAEAPKISLAAAVRQSIRICASICGWVVTFKVLLSYLSTYLFTMLDPRIMICLSGLLELSNGCVQLAGIPNEAVRFILCSAFLAFGGFCVLLQTASATEKIGLGLYLPGKVIQTIISTITATALSCILFEDPSSQLPMRCVHVLAGAVALLLMRAYTKKRSGNSAKYHV